MFFADFRAKICLVVILSILRLFLWQTLGFRDLSQTLFKPVIAPKVNLFVDFLPVKLLGSHLKCLYQAESPYLSSSYPVGPLTSSVHLLLSYRRRMIPLPQTLTQLNLRLRLCSVIATYVLAPCMPNWWVLLFHSSTALDHTIQSHHFLLIPHWLFLHSFSQLFALFPGRCFHFA